MLPQMGEDIFLFFWLHPEGCYLMGRQRSAIPEGDDWLRRFVQSTSVGPDCDMEQRQMFAVFLNFMQGRGKAG